MSHVKEGTLVMVTIRHLFPCGKNCFLTTTNTVYSEYRVSSKLISKNLRVCKVIIISDVSTEHLGPAYKNVRWHLAHS
jgi:hypothetical protein